jgi:hypothetical protein
MAVGDGSTSDLYVYDIERRQQPIQLTVGAKIVAGSGKLGMEPRWALSLLCCRRHYLVGSHRRALSTTRVDQGLSGVRDFA